MQKEYERSTIAQVKNNYKYYQTLSAFYNNRDRFTLETLETCYPYFEKEFSTSATTKKLKKYIEQGKLLTKGSKLPMFYAYDNLDDRVPVKGLPGIHKFTLINFWASWCIPCRAEIKEIRKAYPQLDTASVQIISISMDVSKSKWLEASKTEDLLWESYYDPAAFNGNVAKTFNVIFIPNNFLIDSNGKIISADLKGEQLKNLLNNKFDDLEKN